MMKTLLVVLFLALARIAAALTIAETRIECDQSAIVRFAQDGATPQLIVECVTYDSTGQIVRTKREFEVSNRLTSPQKAGIVTILQQLKTYAATNEVVPTPVP